MPPPAETPPASTPPSNRADANTPAPATKRRSAGTWAGGIMVAFLLYVLSIGPVFRLVQERILPGNIEYIYLPLVWAVEVTHTQTYLETPFLWYLNLWGIEFA